MQKVILGIIGLIIIGGIGWCFMQDGRIEERSNNYVTEETTDVNNDLETKTDTETDLAVDAGLYISTDEETDVAEFTIHAENFEFSVDTITVKEGQRVRINFVNDDGFHDFIIDEFAGAKTDRIDEGQTQTIEFIADKEGTFNYYCSVGQHRALGMEGTFIVE